MGVKLTEIISKKQIAWEELNGKLLAVDAYNTIYQFLSSIRQPDGTPLMDSKGRITSHLVGTLSRVANLIEKGIKLCFVFDGEAPKLKSGERARRAGIKAEAKLKYEKAVEEEDLEGMYKYSKQNVRLNGEMIAELKELLDALGIPSIQAPSEAEAQAAYMCRKKDAWAVASQDYDALLFGTPRLVQNLTLAQKRKLPSGQYVKIYPQLIELKETLKELGLTEDQLIALGILIGTDFNVGGAKGVGPKTALKLLHGQKDFGKIFDGLNVEFDWKEVFDVFKNMPVTDKYNLGFNKVDGERVKQLLVDRHDFSAERVESALSKLEAFEGSKKQVGLHKWF